MSGTANLQYNAPTDFRIAQTTPDEVPPEFRAAFTQLYSAIQQIIFTLVNNAGIGPRNAGDWAQLAGTATTLLSGNLNRFYAQAAEDIPFGAAITFTFGASPIQILLADANDLTRTACRGFCTTAGGIANGDFGEVQVNTGLASISGLTPGRTYWLSTTAGLIAPTPSLAAGTVEQMVGFAITSTTLLFNVGYYIVH